jgi:polyhydroxybutyrate depolymerase
MRFCSALTSLLASLMLLAIAVPAQSADRISKSGDFTFSFSHQSMTREYYLHVPAKALSMGAVPLVLVFHGGGGNGKLIQKYSGLNALSEKEGFAVAYPKGTGAGGRLLTWNAGRCCAYAERNKIDDVGMVRALLKDVKKRIPLDEKRVFASGASNGGFMTFQLGCQLSDKIAAIAPVIGNQTAASCSPSRPVPVIAFNGSADQMVPLKGGIGPKSISRFSHQPVRRTMKQFAERNRCKNGPTVEQLPDRHADNTKVSRESWTDCRKDADVVLYVIEGGGHTWPGSPVGKWGRFGKSTREISAAKLMWEFFQKHPMP